MVWENDKLIIGFKINKGVFTMRPNLKEMTLREKLGQGTALIRHQ